MNVRERADTARRATGRSRPGILGDPTADRVRGRVREGGRRTGMTVRLPHVGLLAV